MSTTICLLRDRGIDRFDRLWRVTLRCLTVSSLAGCLASAKPVRMPDGTSALRIECNYTLDNCERRARSACDGRYDVVTKGDMSCKDCGWDLDSQQRNEPPEGNNVYKGVLYVRCR